MSNTVHRLDVDGPHTLAPGTRVLTLLLFALQLIDTLTMQKQAYERHVNSGSKVTPPQPMPPKQAPAASPPKQTPKAEAKPQKPFDLPDDPDPVPIPPEIAQLGGVGVSTAGGDMEQEIDVTEPNHVYAAAKEEGLMDSRTEQEKKHEAR